MPSASDGQAVTVDAGGVPARLSSPDRMVFPGITKRAVLDYYLAIGPQLLAQVSGRPTALERWPQGVTADGEHFFQKHLPAKVPEPEIDALKVLMFAFDSATASTDPAVIVAFAMSARTT